MRLSTFTTLVLVALLSAWSCSRDPNVVAQKYVESGNRYFENGKYKEASLLYRRALQKNAKFGEAYYRLGLTQLKLGPSALGDAVRALMRAVDLQPRNVDARVKLADIYLLVYGTQPKAEYLTEVNDLKDQLLKINSNSPDALRLDAYLSLLRDKDLNAAIAKFEKANQVAPSRQEIMLPLARALFAARRGEEGEKTARALIQHAKDFGPTYDLLYTYYASNSARLGDAENILKEKLRNIPKVADNYLQLALFYYANKRKPEMEATLAQMTSNAKDFPRGHGWAGGFYFNLREFDNAMREFQEGLKSDPKDANKYKDGMAQVLLAQGKTEDASKLVDEVLKNDPQDPQAQGMRASLLMLNPNPERVQKAIDDLQPLVSKAPKNASVRVNLARALLLKGDAVQARTQLEEAIKGEPNYVPAHLMLAELRLKSREFGGVLQEVDAVLRIDPGNLQAKLLRTGALAGSGDLAKARESVNAAIADSPNSAEPLLQLGSIELADKNYKKAEAVFAKLYQADNRNLRALFGLSDAYSAQGQTEKAIQMLKAELGKQPANAGLRTALANTEVRAGKLDAAIADYQTLLGAHPKSADTYMRISEVYRRKGDSKSAIDNMRKAKGLRPNDAATCVSLAVLLDEAGQQAEAKPLYEQALRIQPDNPIALNNLAYLVAETGGDLDQALTLAQRAKQKMPNDLDVADTLGWIYIRKSLSDSAIDIYRDLVAKDPGRSTFRYHLGMALFQKGDKPQAKKELLAALQAKPSRQEEAKIKELLAKL
ncbi:MAG: tetratricopeptide repeat protein [Acidobacteria bacterium]|nr:tetratricopeptide repeat protein [Acidobacteriota bacterium]